MIVDIWKCSTVERIRELEPYVLGGVMEERALLRYFAAWGAYFERQSPGGPYLAWGSPITKLYPRFVHTAALFSHPRAAAIIADQLVNRLPNRPKPHCVVGPSHGAWGLVSALAQRWGGICQQLTKHTGVRKEQAWDGPPLPQGSRVQLCDDLIRGGGTLEQLVDAIQAANGDSVVINPEVLAVVNVSGKEQLGQFRIVSLVSFKEESLLPKISLGGPSSAVRELRPYLYERSVA